MIWYILGIFSGIWIAQTFRGLPQIQHMFNKAVDLSKNDRMYEVLKKWGTNIDPDITKKD